MDIKIIDEGIDISKVKNQLKKHRDDWKAGMQGTESLLDDKWGFPEVAAGVLQLKIGAVKDRNQFVGDSELTVPTPLIEHHSNIFDIIAQYGIKRNFIDRCGFLSLPVGGTVGRHIDVGNYYLTRDRFHLAIQGKYVYNVGDESTTVNTGTLLWFNNKKEHDTVNVGDVVRITFVFDVPIKYRKKYKFDIKE